VTQPLLADKYLAYAKRIYRFGDKYRGLSSSSIPDSKAFYPSSSYLDDLAWGALWLYKATGNQSYLAAARHHFDAQLKAAAGMPWKRMDWDSQMWATALELSQLIVAGGYSQYPLTFAEAWLNATDGVQMTPKGLAWGAEWGSLRHTANAVFYMLSYAAAPGTDKQLKAETTCFARKQLAYILGQQGTNQQSYVVGYGPNSPQQAHHRSASCTPTFCGWAAFAAPGPNPNVIEGALVGGPGKNDDYVDKRNYYIKNEVAIDYNAGFTGALAALLAMAG
jgi:hypothetical protein